MVRRHTETAAESTVETLAPTPLTHWPPPPTPPARCCSREPTSDQARAGLGRCMLHAGCGASPAAGPAANHLGCKGVHAWAAAQARGGRSVLRAAPWSFAESVADTAHFGCPASCAPAAAHGHQLLRCYL